MRIKFIEKHPELAKQWSDKNDFGPESVSYGSKKKAWRKPPCGHEFQQAIRHWSLYGCPVCAGRLVIAGINDFASAYPNLIAQWSDKNTISPDSISRGSSKKAWRKPPCGHEFQQIIEDWYKTNCSVCAGRIVIPGVNDFATTHPELAKQWSKKNTFNPDSISHGSGLKAWRLHRCGHEYEQAIYTWKNLVGCKLCIKPGKEFSAVYPELVSQWSRKNDLSPESVSFASYKKAWRNMDCGHEFEQVIRNWHKYGCPICSGGIILPGVNDFASANPELVKQWSKKNMFGPNTVGKSSGKKAWRTHPCGHEFQQKIADWVDYGCHQCSIKISKPEQALFDFIKTLCPDAIQSERLLISPRELDIYVPSKNIAIEFNGLYWHSSNFLEKNYHYDKWLACKTAGVQLITIWEDQWRDNQDVIKKMLTAKLIGGPSIGARKTKLKFITYQECSNFLDSWHIQGSCTGRFYIGLFNKETLIGVCVISKTGELRRYASSISIIGGLDKCLKFSGLTEFYTFADHCVFAGGLYESTGWVFNKELRPDYKYVNAKSDTLEHKFNYRIKRFKEDPNLFFAGGMTESQLARKNSILRVYDCGKTRYVKRLDNR